MTIIQEITECKNLTLQKSLKYLCNALSIDTKIRVATLSDIQKPSDSCEELEALSDLASLNENRNQNLYSFFTYLNPWLKVTHENLSKNETINAYKAAEGTHIEEIAEDVKKLHSISDPIAFVEFAGNADTFIKDVMKVRDEFCMCKN